MIIDAQPLPTIDCFTVNEVAERFHAKPALIRSLLRTGQIQSFKVGSTWRVTADSLQSFIMKGMEAQS